MVRLEVAAANQLTTRVKASGHYLNRAPRNIKKNTIQSRSTSSRARHVVQTWEKNGGQNQADEGNIEEAMQWLESFI